MKTRFKILIPLLLVVAAVTYLGGGGQSSITYAPDARGPEPRQSTTTRPTPSAIETTLAEAYKQRRSNLQVTGSLQVSRILPDDNEGSRHQRFILETSTGQTILVAHNIDLAPRIAQLQVGDTVEFYGEYEWNEKGGVIHWTHHDPQNRHPHGWLRHEGRLYQ